MTGTIVWFRLDLRLHDNPALTEAVRLDEPIYPVFIWSPDEEGNTQPGAASKWWLHHSLFSLGKHIESLGASLILRSGNAEETLLQLAEETGATRVFWSDRYEPDVVARDEELKRSLSKNGLKVRTFNASLLLKPDTVLVDEQRPYRLFTPFFKRAKEIIPKEPLGVPEMLATSTTSKPVRSLAISELELLPAVDWDAGLRQFWRCGETAALARLHEFKKSIMSSYTETRNIPGVDGTSLMSPHLHFGEISPRLLWYAMIPQIAQENEGAIFFIRELYWREFAYYALVHFPKTVDQPMRQEFKRMPWHNSKSAIRQWHKGQTGYPIVDAGMRQLWHIGWMHNRVRMIVGSFLTKDLLESWQEGAAWFWDTLVDADTANNTMGWQWVTGCGVDAAPFFRIFNPVSQGERFDPDGTYIRKWVPELAKLPNAFIHRPWEAPPFVLQDAQVELGCNYPLPIVDHGQAREDALSAFATIRGA